MSEPADGIAGPSYPSDGTIPDNAAAAFVSSTLRRSSRSRRGAQRSAHKIEALMFALRIEHRIRGYLQRILGSHQEVSDLLQDVYLQLLIASDRPCHTIESTTAYVMTAARNRAYDWLRRQKLAARLCPTIDIDDVEISAEGMRPDELVGADDELDRLSAAISSLPSGCQQIFVLRKVHGMSHKMIAYKVGIAVHTVEQHMTRAMRLLGQTLERYDSEYALLYAVRENVTRFQVGKRKPAHSAQTFNSRSRLLRQNRRR